MFGVGAQFKTLAKVDGTLLGLEAGGVEDCRPFFSFEIKSEEDKRTSAKLGFEGSNVFVELWWYQSLIEGVKGRRRTCSA